MPDSRSMDGILEELDEAKADIERLQLECNRKGELSEKLKRVNSEQFSKLQEANLKIEKQAQYLNEKGEELSLEKKRCEEFEKKITEKESVIKHLSSANDKLRADGDDNFLKLEEEKRSLLLALDDTSEKCMNQEQQISSYKEEIEGLKKCLSLSQRKCSEAEERSMAEKDLRGRDDWITELNDENTKVKDQLKWKMEQFKHLEGALEKVRDEFKVSKREWETEKATLLDEISSLETKLDSQMVISKDLQNKLEMCNQALAHEESRRKCLQVQVTEFQTRFENGFDECEHAKMKFDEMAPRRDEEIAGLRCLLGTKDSFLKEREYQTQKVELENQELRTAIKELQEAQIQEAGASSSFKKLQNKLKSLETAHGECTANLCTKEVEWKSQMEAILSELNDCKSVLSRREATIKDFEAVLESHYSEAMQLKLENEELSAILLVLNQGISEAQMKLSKEMTEVSMHEKDREEKNYLLMKQLEVQNAALVKANQDIEETVTKRVEALDLVEEQLYLNQKELDSNEEMLQESFKSQLNAKQYESKLIELDQYKEMFEESNRDHHRLKEQVLQIESDARDRLQEACTALAEANAELADKICEGNQIDFEMHMWKSIAERLKFDLEENHELRRELEASLLAEIQVGEILKQEKDVLNQILKEKDRRIESLEQQVTLLEQGLEIIELEATTLSGTETATSFELMREKFLQTIREKNELLERLQNEVESLEQDLLKRDLESQFGAERMFEQEKEKLIQMVEMKNMRIDQLMQLVESLEQKFVSSLTSFSSKLDEKQTEISLVHRAWEKINAAEILAVLETEEKKLMITELEDSIREIQQKLELQETSLDHAKEKAMKIEADLEVKESEMKRLTNHMKTQLTHSDAIIDELKSEKSNLIEDVMKLSSEKEELMGVIGGIGSHISQFCNSDKELMGLLEKIMLSFSNECQRVELKCENELSFSRENVNSPPVKRFEFTAEARSPFRQLNG